MMKNMENEMGRLVEKPFLPEAVYLCYIFQKLCLY